MTLHEKLQDVFRTVFADESLLIDGATTAGDVPGWDSVAHINLMFALEQAFGVQFPGNELAEFKCVGELMEWLQRQ